MLLKLQKYNLQVKYKKGEMMFLADTLSHAYLPEVNTCEFAQNLEKVDHTNSLALSDDRLQQHNHASENDPVLQVLHSVWLAREHVRCPRGYTCLL